MGSSGKRLREVRRAELTQWENAPKLRMLRLTMLICCWVSVVIFIAIPAGFSIAYAMTFPERTAIKWMQGWLIDMVLGVIVFESGALFGSIALGWLYVRLCSGKSATAHPPKPGKHVKKRTPDVGENLVEVTVF